MVTHLLDTNVLSELSRPQPDATVLTRFAEVADDAAIAAVTWHELRFGVARLPSGRRREVLEVFVARVAGRLPVLPYDRQAAAWHATERARQQRAGTPAPFVDGEIAATAVTNRLRLVTRNVADFSGVTRLRVENGWSWRA